MERPFRPVPFDQRHSTPGHPLAAGGRIEKNLGYKIANFSRAWRSWIVPYLKGRLHQRKFSPVLSFLYTDLNCNLECPYCYSRGRKIQGISFETAVKAVDWLDACGCRVLAYMGGEPLVRKDLIIELTRYAVSRGFFVYLPTNGILLDDDFIDRIGKAGVAAINLAVDSVDGQEEIPKYFNRIRPQFERLIEREPLYGYITFLNINITSKNIDDVRSLTEMACEYGVATDYHINEPPPIDYNHFDRAGHGTWIKDSDLERVEGLIDWLIQKNLEGYTMVNSVDHLLAMKRFIRHELPPWPCRAGELTMVIRLDGSFAPCFELYGTEEDWGNIFEGHRFDEARLNRLKKECSPRCLSTCNYQVHHYTRSILYSLQWVSKHVYSGLFGIS